MMKNGMSFNLSSGKEISIPRAWLKEQFRLSKRVINEAKQALLVQDSRAPTRKMLQGAMAVVGQVMSSIKRLSKEGIRSREERIAFCAKIDELERTALRALTDRSGSDPFKVKEAIRAERVRVGQLMDVIFDLPLKYVEPVEVEEDSENPEKVAEDPEEVEEVLELLTVFDKNIETNLFLFKLQLEVVVMNDWLEFKTALEDVEILTDGEVIKKADFEMVEAFLDSLAGVVDRIMEEIRIMEGMRKIAVEEVGGKQAEFDFDDVKQIWLEELDCLYVTQNRDKILGIVQQIEGFLARLMEQVSELDLEKFKEFEMSEVVNLRVDQLLMPQKAAVMQDRIENPKSLALKTVDLDELPDWEMEVVRDLLETYRSVYGEAPLKKQDQKEMVRILNDVCHGGLYYRRVCDIVNWVK